MAQTPELPYGRNSVCCNSAFPNSHQFGASLQTYSLAAWVHDLSIGRCLIDLAMASVLKSMNRDTIPAQGYRSTFRDRTKWPSGEIIYSTRDAYSWKHGKPSQIQSHCQKSVETLRPIYDTATKLPGAGGKAPKHAVLLAFINKKGRGVMRDLSL